MSAENERMLDAVLRELASTNMLLYRIANALDRAYPPPVRWGCICPGNEKSDVGHTSEPTR